MLQRNHQASELVGANPPFAARPVSLAVRDYLVRRQTELVRSRPDTTYGVLVAVSGGADSLALAVAAADVAFRYEIPLIARTVDHQMRDGSGPEAHGVVQTLGALGIEAAVLSSTDGSNDIGSDSTGATTAEGPEGAARTLRYAFLEDEAARWGSQKKFDVVDILLGHTMDDQAETVLLRLARGASPEALAAMRPLLRVTPNHSESPGPAIYRARPLLSARRADTLAFCDTLGLQPIEDPTNRADGPWRTKAGGALPRSAVRERVLPEMGAALEQDPVPALARVAAFLADDNDVLDQFAAKVLGEATCGPTAPGQLALDVLTLQVQPRSIRTRVLKRAVAEVGLQVTSAPQIEELERALWREKNAAGFVRRVILPGGGVAERDGTLLRFEAASR